MSFISNLYFSYCYYIVTKKYIDNSENLTRLICNPLSTRKMNGADYLLLAGDDSHDRFVKVQSRDSGRFLTIKRNSEDNLQGNVQIYKWTGLNYDLIETLPSKRPSQVIHFLINNFHFITVAEGHVGKLVCSHII